MCVYVCVCMCMHVYLCICMCNMCIYVSVCICMYLYVSVCICLYLYVSVCICMYLYVSVCICMYMYISVCICMYNLPTCMGEKNWWLGESERSKGGLVAPMTAHHGHLSHSRDTKRMDQMKHDDTSVFIRFWKHVDPNGIKRYWKHDDTSDCHTKDRETIIKHRINLESVELLVSACVFPQCIV